MMVVITKIMWNKTMQVTAILPINTWILKEWGYSGILVLGITK
jgi:hypothetical protein